jgi:hypothetical protein
MPHVAASNQKLNEQYSMNSSTASALAVSLLLGACAAQPARVETTNAPQASAAAPAPGAPRVVKSRDGSYTGEVIGTPAPDSKFAKLAIGMETTEVQKIVGRFPDQVHSYESGKRWIPFYFGNDARRMQVLYKGEGCLVFTGGGAFSSGGDLIQIQVDPSGACYAP